MLSSLFVDDRVLWIVDSITVRPQQQVEALLLEQRSELHSITSQQVLGHKVQLVEHVYQINAAVLVSRRR